VHQFVMLHFRAVCRPSDKYIIECSKWLLVQYCSQAQYTNAVYHTKPTTFDFEHLILLLSNLCSFHHLILVFSYSHFKTIIHALFVVDHLLSIILFYQQTAAFLSISVIKSYTLVGRVKGPCHLTVGLVVLLYLPCKHFAYINSH
jgi:hypothetical protein